MSTGDPNSGPKSFLTAALAAATFGMSMVPGLTGFSAQRGSQMTGSSASEALQTAIQLAPALFPITPSRCRPRSCESQEAPTESPFQVLPHLVCGCIAYSRFSGAVSLQAAVPAPELSMQAAVEPELSLQAAVGQVSLRA